MKKITPSNRFKKDYKRAEKRGCDPRKFQEVLTLLVNDEPLPERCRPHKLVGQYEGYWECHISPDWLLIYDFGEDWLDLARTGSHSDLFK